MKGYMIPALLCIGACFLIGCGESSVPEDSAQTETTAAAVTTAATTVTTTTETTTVTTTTKPDYLLAEDIVPEIDPATLRTTKCKVKLTNQGENNQPYTKNYRILDHETEKELRLISEEDKPKSSAAEGVMGPGGWTEINADWEKRYGSLQDGLYLLEIELEQVADPDSAEDSDADPVMLRKVVRTDLEIDSAGFEPRLSIDPATVTPQGCTLTVKNSPDTGRSYSMVYRLYDESSTPRKELLRELDEDARIAGNFHMDPGGTLTLPYNWRESYGALLEGTYVIEIDLLPEDGTPAKAYSATFVVE